MTEMREKIDELELLMARATPRPWPRVSLAHVTVRHEIRSDGTTLRETHFRPEDNLLCAATVNALPDLIAAVRAALSPKSEKQD